MKLSVALVHALMRLAAHLERTQDNVARFSEAFAARAIDPAELSALTVQQYGAVPSSSSSDAGLVAWERAWLERDLPPPPAKLLVGGCGAGRELRELLRRGYAVYAFDPVRECVQQCQRDLPQVARVEICSYEEFCAPASERSAQVEALHDAAPFDAILLGWGSVTHVLDERDQEQLFETLARIAPQGPILASFWLRPQLSGGRAAALGYAFAKWLRLDRSSSVTGSEGDQAPMRERVRCAPRVGFAYVFDRERLERLAHVAGRTLTLHADEYPHATFEPTQLRARRTRQ